MFINKNKHYIDEQKKAKIINHDYEVIGRVKKELIENQTTIEKLVKEEVSNKFKSIYGFAECEVARRWKDVEMILEDHETRIEICEARQLTF